MCGRYSLNATPRDLSDYFGDVLPAEEFERYVPFESYNIAPSARVPVIRYSKHIGRNVLEPLTWGFRPKWASKAWINARDNTLLDTSLFREAARKRRCLVPANGWYEWQKVATRKQPYYFTYPHVFAFAGVWTARPIPEADWQVNFAIVTTAARPGVEHIHDRMPLVLGPGSFAAWLDPAATDPSQFLLPSDEAALEAWPVSTRVNSPDNDDVGLIEPLTT